MDAELRRMINEACALDDEARQCCGYSPPDKVEKRHSRELVYKTKDDALQLAHAPEEDQAVDPVRALGEEVGLLAEDIGAVTGMLRKQVRELSVEIGSLRAELTLLRAQMNGTVTPLKADRDAA